jgi:hypothetical protein
MPESVRSTQLRSRIGSIAPSSQVLAQRKVSPPFVGSQVTPRSSICSASTNSPRSERKLPQKADGGKEACCSSVMSFGLFPIVFRLPHGREIRM